VQPELGKGEGPIAVICAPTRELAQQIFAEAKKFAKPFGIRVSGVLGGMSKFEQFKELKAGVEVVVATPVRHQECEE
jgi:ATP-dependent RNA helicase DDX42